MRRAFISLLILSVFGGQVGMLGALLIGRHRVQKRMRRRVQTASQSPGEAAALQHLVIPRSAQKGSSSSFVRINDREFRYRGKLYDIVHEERRGATWHVWALHDRQEEHYLKALAQTLDAPVRLVQSVRSTHRQPRAYRKPALVTTMSTPSPAMRLRSFPSFPSLEPQAPCLEVPHPPPWVESVFSLMTPPPPASALRSG